MQKYYTYESELSREDHGGASITVYLTSDVDALLAQIKDKVEEGLTAWEACDTRAAMSEISVLMERKT